jgi:hypothetical protein
MRRSFLFALVFVVGSSVGWIARERPVSARPKPEREPVSTISISHPDPASPDGFKCANFQVVAAGSEKVGAGVQQPHEWNVVLWYPADDGEPRRCERFRLARIERLTE